MADAGVAKLELQQAALAPAEMSYDGDDDDEVALVAAATEPATDDDYDLTDEAELDVDGPPPTMANGGRSEAQVNGVMVLTLLDKIIGVVDQIQQTQNGLEARQESMEKSVSGIQGELTKLSKSHAGTSTTVNKMLDKVRKVSVNVKTVRSNLEKQAGQIKRLESNENELLKRRNFKVLIYQDENKTPKAPKPKAGETVTAGAAVDGHLEQIPEEGDDGCVPVDLHSDEEGGAVEIEETVVEVSRAERIKRSGRQRVDNIKKAFSKEKMEKHKLRTKENLEKTKLRTRENLEKTKQRTRENLEKTKHSLEKKMGKLSSRMTATSPNPERKEKPKEKTPESVRARRSKMTVYRVPPFTFHVKKIRDGDEEDEEEEEEETRHNVAQTQVPPAPEGEHLRVEVQEGELVDVDSPAMKAFLKVAASEGLLDGDDDAIGLEVEVEEGELVSVEEEDEEDDGPEMKALLEAAEDSRLVMVEESDLHLGKKHRK